MRKIGISIWPAHEIPFAMNWVTAAAEKTLALNSLRSISALSFFSGCPSKKCYEQKNGTDQRHNADAIAEVIRPVKEEHQTGRQQSQPNEVEVARLRLFTIIGKKENGEQKC